MPLYETYSGSRPPVTEEERQRVQNVRNNTLNRALPYTSDCRRIGNILVVDDPILNAWAQIGYDRSQSARNGDKQRLPDIPDAHVEFPGVNPQGNFCHRDMAFSQRLDTLRAQAAVCPPANREALNAIFEVMDTLDQQNPMTRLYVHMKDDCRFIRNAELAAKACPDRDASHALEAASRDFANQSEYIRLYDRMLLGMEQLAGLAAGNLDRQTHTFFNRALQASQLGYIPDDIATGANVGRVVPQTMSVQMPDLDQIHQQQFLARPQNWGAPAAAAGEVMPGTEAMDRLVSVSTAAVAGRMLDTLYAGDHNFSDAPEMGNNRGTLVIIDGKTIEERMAERYRAAGGADGSGPYQQWYRENLREMSAQMVADALMNGKRVDAFQVDAKGKLSDPIRMTKTGYAPKLDTPVTLNAWQRFWSRHGFYQDKATQATQSREFAEARDRMAHRAQIHYASTQQTTSRDFQTMFFRDALQTYGMSSMADVVGACSPNSTWPLQKADRSSYVGLCIGLMAHNGIPMEKILDPNALQAEKQALGAAVLKASMLDPATGEVGADREHRLGDPNFFATAAFLGQKALMKELDRLMNGVDMHDHARMQQLRPLVSACTDAAFDMSQDIKTVRAEYAQAASLYAKPGEDLGNTVDTKCNQAASVLRLYYDGVDARYNVGAPRSHRADTALTAIAVGNCMADMMPPTDKFTDRLPHYTQTLMLRGELSGNDNFRDAVEAVVNHGGDWRIPARMALSGELDRAVRVTPGNPTAQQPQPLGVNVAPGFFQSLGQPQPHQPHR